MNVEFEDVIAEVDDADIVVPRPDRLSSLTFRVLCGAAMRQPASSRLSPGFRAEGGPLGQDLAVAIVSSLAGLVALNSVRGWRREVGKAVCVLREAWTLDLHKVRGAATLLNQFDHVFCEYAQSVDALQSLIEVPCTYLATGIDTVRFSPLPHLPARSVDVFNVGRRVGEVHEALMAERDRSGLFYYFTTVRPTEVWDPVEHRLLFADILKRSRYSLVKRAKFGFSDQQEIGFRYFEGAAAGAVLVGDKVANDAFPRLFDWQDAVVETADAEVVDRIRELDARPERVAAIRRQNVVQMLRRHDCAYRWEEILRTVGLSPLPRLEERRHRLEALAERAERVL